VKARRAPRRVPGLRPDASRALSIAAESAARASGLHDSRVAGKRLRALWRLLFYRVGREESDHRRRALAHAARALGSARDLESVRQLATALACDPADEAGSACARALGLLPEPPRDAALAGPLAALVHASHSSAHALIAAVVGASGDDLRRGLERLHRRLAKGVKRARRSPGAEELHDCRKRAKDLQYALEALATDRVRAGLCREAAERLGRARDLRRLAPAIRGSARVLLTRRAAVLEAEALRLLAGWTRAKASAKLRA